MTTQAENSDQGLDGLIAALQIFRKYDNPRWPTHCEHDYLYVLIKPHLVSEEDLERLDELGFSPDEEEDCFISYKFGSA